MLPVIGLLAILISTSSIVFEEQLPIVPVGIGVLHIADFLLVGSLGLIVIRRLIQPGFRIVRTSLDLPLLIFYAVTLFSTFIAIFQSSLEVVEARRGIRVLSYYLTFFVVTNLVRDRRQLNLLLNGLFLLATIVAAVMAAQFLLGESVQLLPGRIESLATQDTVFEDITRILPPGWSIVLVSFVAILCILVVEKFKLQGLMTLLQCGLLGMAILVTFLRSYWAALIMVLFILVYLLRGVDRRRLIAWGLVVISSAAMILLLVCSDPDSRATKLVGASWQRLSTLGRSGTFQGEDSSVDWRRIENEYAFSAIASNPLIGLGMCARYRPYDSRVDVGGPDATDFDFQRHIHNGHLLILLQSGLLGYFSFMWLSLAFLMRGFRCWRSVANGRMRGVVLGFALVYLAILVAAVANSTFMHWSWTPVIGIIIGINEVILRKVGQEAS
jgi:O-antigen ligase